MEKTLETAGEQAGIGAETVRGYVEMMLAVGRPMSAAADLVAFRLYGTGYGTMRVCDRKARALVRLAYLGS